MALSGAFLADLLAALACGGLTGLALPRPGLCLLAWFSLAPLFYLWRRCRDWRRAALIGLAAGFGYHGTVLYWIYSTCRFAGLLRARSACWLGVRWRLFMALNWALIGALGRRFAEGRGALAALGLGRAVDRGHLLLRALDAAPLRRHPGLYAMALFLPCCRSSSLAGPHFLGFLIVAANAVLERAWDEAEPGGPLARRRAQYGGGPGLAGRDLGLRDLRADPARVGRPGPAARVEFLQPAVDQYQKFDAQHARDIMANFDELLSRPRTAPPALVIWPETCLPYLVEAGRGLQEAAAWGRKLGAFQIVGVVSREGAALRNSAFLLSPSGDVRGVYHKRQLVPFGEFQPLQVLGPVHRHTQRVGRAHGRGAGAASLRDSPGPDRGQHLL